jgi:hypothetical protein
MKIGSFYELDSTNGISPNILYASCNSGGCAFCSPGPENPVGMTAYQSDLNLLRFSDQDTYGFMIERNENINAIGKQWIRSYSLALCKETLGQVRSKYSSVPIPGESITLNGTALISEAKDEKEALKKELGEILEATTYDKLAATTAELTDSTSKILERIPTTIMVG